jgi:hypothetical protein|tara:strand:+ start:59 stop:2557 length:2499 start_codon:yes stop_codon:yes gene_type:complete
MAGRDQIKRQKEYNKLVSEGTERYREFQGIFESIAGELGQKQVNYAKEAKREYDGLVSISRKLADNEEEINELNDKQLDALRSQAASNVKQIKQTIDKVALKGAENEQEEALLKAKSDGLIIEDDLLKKIDNQIQLRKEANRLMGVAGGLLSALNEAAGPFAKALKLDQVEKDMKKVADRVADTGEGFGKIQVLAAGVGSAIGSAFSTITDPAVVIGSVLSAFGDIQKSQKEFRQQTGQSVDQFADISSTLASNTDQLKAATALTKELNVNASVIFSPETIAEVAELTEFMGMGAHEAAQLAKFSKLSGQELSKTTADMESNFKNFVYTERTGLNFKKVMDDVGSVSSAVSMSLGSNPDAIMDAALAAGKLGISLQKVDEIAGSLLDFESSIAAEMEAELLIGKELNLEKARQAALNNDLATVAEELAKNEGAMKAFATGNRIQQEAVAKAMGMSREEMAKMIYQQKLQNGLSEQQAADAANMSLEDAKRLTAQESIAKAMEKVAQAAANILDFFMPILDNAFVLHATLLTTAAIIGGKMLIGLRGSLKEMSGMVKASLDFLKNTKASEILLGKFYKGGQFMKGGGQAQKGGQRAGGLLGKFTKNIGGSATETASKQSEKLKKITDNSKGLKPTVGAGILSFFTGLTGGLKLFAKGMATMTPFGPVGLVAPLALAALTSSLIPLGFALALAAPAFKAFGTIITSIFSGVATVVTAVAAGLVSMMGAVTMDNIGPMLLLGPALLGIAAGLAAMALAGPGALPIIGALGALALVAAPLAALAGVFGGDDGGDDEESEIVKKLDQLIAVVEKGGDVFMDGNKVGRSLTLTSSQVG